MIHKNWIILRGGFLFAVLLFFNTHAADKTNNTPIEPTKTAVTKQLERIVINDQQYKERKNIKIIGAGIAGLTAAYELSKLGHAVEVIEASSRVGGRIWTHTFDSTKEYGELGAMRIPASHDFTRYYIGVTGLTKDLRPFITAYQNPNCFYNLRGQTCRMSMAANLLQKEYQLSAYEQEIVSTSFPPEILLHHLVNALRLLRLNKVPPENADQEEWAGLMGGTFLNDHARELEATSLGEFLKQRVESKDARELIGVATGLELWWDKALTMFLREGITQTGDGLEEIAGGFSRLPEALVGMLINNNVKIRMNTEVVSIELPDASDQKIKFKTRPTDPAKWDSPPTNEVPHDETSDFMICTIPFGVLRTMELKGLSPLKMNAIRNLSYTSSTKILLNFKDRFWERGSPEESIFGGASISDQIIRQVYYPSDHAQIIQPITPEKPKEFNGVFTISEPLMIEPMPGFAPPPEKLVPGVLLGSYCWGQDAIRLGCLSPDERAEIALNEVEKLHPKAKVHEQIHPTEGHKSMFWDSYRWSLGAFCGMRPNDMRDYHYASKKPEGNLYIAGEHCSLDPGWIQGAIKSSLDVVEALLKAKPIGSQ